MFSNVKTQNTHLKSCGTFHTDQKTSIMEMKWFYAGFALMGVLHRGFPGKMSRQTVSKAQNEGNIHLDATVLKRDLLICHFKWNTNFNSSPVKSIPLSSSSRHLSFLFFLSSFLSFKSYNRINTQVRNWCMNTHTPPTNKCKYTHTHKHTQFQTRLSKSPASLRKNIPKQTQSS